MAMSIKSIPVLKGQDAANFVAEADNNKNQATPEIFLPQSSHLAKVVGTFLFVLGMFEKSQGKAYFDILEIGEEKK